MKHWGQGNLFYVFCSFYWAILTLTEPTLPAAHFILARRGGQLVNQPYANLTRLVELLHQAENKFESSTRTITGNKVERRWKVDGTGRRYRDELFADVGRLGSWYASINVGDPPQILEFDLDMLSPDFYLISTTEIDRVGSKYDSFTSKSHAGSEDRVHPECRLPTDLLHLTNMTLSASISLRIPMCGPPKYSRRTLTPSGNVLGLAPSRAMAQTSHSSLVELLSEVLPEKLWSIALLDTQSGILSIGSTTAPHFEEAKIRTQLGLQNLEKQGVDVTAVNQEIQTQIDASRLKDWHDYFRWSDVQGAVGWWTTLMQGVWVNGAKTLKNQPVLFDIQMPFILAPPLAASRFYEAISGSKRLDKPFDMFFAFPCLNPPSVAFEFDGWRFPTMTGQWSNVKASKETSGGKFSLGQEKPGSGYCIGLVVETSAGLSHDADTHGSRTNEAAANGLRDLWIIGEPFFRGIGLVFDVGEQKIGFRSY